MTAETLAKWREALLDGGLAALKTRGADHRDEQIRDLQRKVGDLT